MQKFSLPIFERKGKNSFCKHIFTQYFLLIHIQVTNMSHICNPPCVYGLLLEPVNVHVANKRAHQSGDTLTAKTRPCFPSSAVSTLRESKRRHKALSVSAVCLNLTFLCVCMCVCICGSPCVCKHLCHKPLQRKSGSVVLTSDPGMLRDRGREGRGGGGGGGQGEGEKRHTPTYI